MQPAQLRYFDQVARLGSIRRASEQLNVAASAVSRQISMLEREIGQPLIERLPRGVRLTAAGSLLAEHLREVESEYARVRSMLDQLLGGLRGTVRLALIEGMVAESLPRVLTGFAQRYPDVRVEVNIVGSAMATELVRDDTADLTVVYHSRNLTRLSLEAGRVDPFCAVLAPSHPLAMRSGLRIAELVHLPVILNDTSYATRNLVDQAAGITGVSFCAVCTINSIEGAKALARFGLGIAFLPRFAVEREIRSRELVAIPLLDEVFEDTRLMLLTRRHRKLPLHVVAMRDAFVEEFRRG